jgi:hypothetical protein
VSARRLRPIFFAAIVLTVALAALRPVAQTPVAEADLGSPGGIAALPSSMPAVPGIFDQGIPAIISSGQYAVVVSFCFNELLPAVAGECPDVGGDSISTIQFQMERIYPSGSPAASFAATGTITALVADNGDADMDAATGVVAVEVDAGWGANEVVRVTAIDETGDSRSVDIVMVDTMLAWGPTGQVTHDGPVFISYRCDLTGRVPLAEIPATVDPDADGSQGLDDMYDGLFAGAYGSLAPGDGYGSNTLVGDVDFIDTWCGGDTGGSLFDDFVDFQTNKGIFSIDPIAVAATNASYTAGLAGVFYPPILDYDCGEGKTIDTFDVDALTSWAAFLSGWPPGGPAEGGCDLDGWRNGVVTTELLSNGDVGVANIDAQQGGGSGPLRTINVTFVGPPSLLLFLTGPEVTNPDRNPFTVMVVDQDGRPVADEVVECHTDPPSAPFGVDPSTATTGSYSGPLPGEATFDPGLVAATPHIVGGEEFDLTCVVQSDPNVSATVTVTVPLWWGAVGGIAELPDFAGTSAEEAGASAGGSGWSAGGYAALAGGLAVAALAAVAGAWYARRRWLR